MSGILRNFRVYDLREIQQNTKENHLENVDKGLENMMLSTKYGDT